MHNSTDIQLPDLIDIERAARIMAPICDHSNGPLEGGIQYIEKMLSKQVIDFFPREIPANLVTDKTPQALSQKWFMDLVNGEFGNGHEWGNQFFNWLVSDFQVSRSGILRNLEPPSANHHTPVENVDAAGTSWSFPQALAWIATRDPIEVARIEYLQHWAMPPENENPILKLMLHDEETRKKLIGWLVLITSQPSYCRCGSTVTFEREAWESCQCVGQAYDELYAFAQGRGHPIPEYRPKPSYASFSLTWPEGAHNLRFTRSEIMRKWGPRNASDVPLNEQEIKFWIKSNCSGTNIKSGWIEFKKLFAHRACKKDGFDTIWKELHNHRGRGRPPKK